MMQRLLRAAALVLTVLVVNAPAMLAQAATAETAADAARLKTPARRLQMKAMQQRQLMSEPMARRHEERERNERFRTWLKQHNKGVRGARLKPLDSLAGSPGVNGRPLARHSDNATAGAFNNLAALAPNVLINDPSGDTPGGTAQAEVSIVGDGPNLVAAWNDGEGFNTVPNTSTQGYAWSTNAGVTWTDGGAPPVAIVTKWTSDPVLTVDTKRHLFYYSALIEPTATTNGVGVVAGTFSAGSFSWGTPTTAIAGANSTFAFDKQWVACDSSSGNVYLVYTTFYVGGDRIDFRSSADFGATWAPGNAKTISSSNDAGYVQGARVAVGPNGEIHTAWYAIGQSDNTTFNFNSAYGRDYFRYRKGTLIGPGSPGGTTFASQATIDSIWSGYSNGAPGFNRGNGVNFPGVAVDMSTGPNRGRLYVCWNETQNFFYDALGTTVGPAEVPDAGGSPGAARAFTLGDYIRGQINGGDEDWWKFNGTAGQTVIMFVDSLRATLDLGFELYAPNGVDQLAFNENGAGAANLIVFTLPSNGTYFLHLYAWDFASTGRYNVATGIYTQQVGNLADRARDHRDVYVKYTDGAGGWTGGPVRGNQGPAGFDDWLPEVAVADNGTVFLAWYDFHDDLIARFAGAGSNVYLARSSDGGASWSAGSPVTDYTTYWTDVLTNLAPNQGDYISLFAQSNGVLTAWADGRSGDPDVYMAHVDLAYTAIEVSLASASATADGVSIAWQASTPLVDVAVERRTESGEWAAVATIASDGTGRLAYQDRAVTTGVRYGYRLRITHPGPERTTGETWVEVPARLDFALRGVHPNPSSGPLAVSFTLPDAAPASLELVDVSGRRVSEQDVGHLGGGTHVVDLAGGRGLSAGVYLVRLTRADRTLITRVSLIR